MSTELDPEERYLIAYYRSAATWTGTWWTWLIIHLFLGGLFIYGLNAPDSALVFTAFGAIFLLDLYSRVKQPRHMRTMQSALNKLEQRIKELEQRPSAAPAQSQEL